MPHKSFYRSEFLHALANHLILPFLPVYALTLGATKTLIGLQSTLPNLVSTASQLLWSNVTEGVRRKKVLVILGGVLWSIMWLSVAFVQNVYQLIVLLTMQAFFLAISVPAWTALFIQSTPVYKRGELSGKFYLSTGVGSFLGTLLAGVILVQYGFVPFIFFMAFFIGVLSKVVAMKIEEPSIPRIRKKRMFSLRYFTYFKNQIELSNLTIARSFLSFAVALPGPLFAVYIIQNLAGSMLDVAIISAMGTIAAIVSYRAWGTLIDYIGKRAITLSALILITLVPFWYFIVPRPEWLYLFSMLGGMSWAGFNLAVFTYLSDIMPKEGMRHHIAMFNTTNGLAASAGYFCGGLLADAFSIPVVFLLSMLLRAISITLFSKLAERTGFKLKSLMHFELQPSNIVQGIGNFVATYSLFADEIRKETVKIRSRLRERRKKLRVSRKKTKK